MSVAPPVRTLRLATGVTLHGIDVSDGDALVTVHGGGRDYSYFRHLIAPFSTRYRVVGFSRRYAWPNDNAPIVPDYSPRTDAADLAALCNALGIRRAHFLGASIGGFACLVLATQRPDLVRSLVLAEPPIMKWAADLPGGDEAYATFHETAFQPAGDAFRAGDPERAMQLITDGFLGAGSFAGFKASRRARILQGARDWEAQATSSDSFSTLTRESVAALRMPVLLLSGGRTTVPHRIVDDELARILPGARRVIAPEASHDVWLDAPDLCRDETLRFLAGVP